MIGKGGLAPPGRLSVCVYHAAQKNALYGWFAIVQSDHFPQELNLSPRRIRRMRNICAIAALLCLACVLSAAQSSSNAEFDEVKFYGGYQYTRLDSHAVQDVLNLQHALDLRSPCSTSVVTRACTDGILAGKKIRWPRGSALWWMLAAPMGQTTLISAL